MGEVWPAKSGGGGGKVVAGNVGEVQVFCGEHPDHARPIDLRGVDRRDPGVRLHTADEGHMDGPRRRKVGNITTATRDQAKIFQAE